MKKIYFSLLSLLGAFTVNAQLTQANHAPADSETYDMYRCDSVTTNPGAAGANAVWNFSGITTFSSLVRSYTTQAVVTTTYPAAGLALSAGVNDISFLASTTSSLGYYGGNIAVGMINGSITYTAPAVYGSYPMNLNTTSSAATGGTLYIPSLSMNGTFTGNSNVLADGSGTISLPGGVTYSNTMRVVTSQTLIIVASLANATVTQVNYNYHASGIKAPVFSISTSTAVISSFAGNSTTTQTNVARNKNAVATPTTVVSIHENTTDNVNFSVFPNPSNTYVNFVTNSSDANHVSVYDITGKLVEKQVLNEGKSKVDVSSYNKGLYLYTISTSDNRTLKSGKITVSQ